MTSGRRIATVVPIRARTPRRRRHRTVRTLSILIRAIRTGVPRLPTGIRPTATRRRRRRRTRTRRRTGIHVLRVVVGVPAAVDRVVLLRAVRRRTVRDRRIGWRRNRLTVLAHTSRTCSTTRAPASIARLHRLAEPFATLGLTTRATIRIHARLLPRRTRRVGRTRRLGRVHRYCTGDTNLALCARTFPIAFGVTIFRTTTGKLRSLQQMQPVATPITRMRITRSRVVAVDVVTRAIWRLTRRTTLPDTPRILAKGPAIRERLFKRLLRTFPVLIRVARTLTRRTGRRTKRARSNRHGPLPLKIRVLLIGPSLTRR